MIDMENANPTSKPTQAEIDAAFIRLNAAWRLSGFELVDFASSLGLNAAERMSLESGYPLFRSRNEIERIDEKIAHWDGSKLVVDEEALDQLVRDWKASGLSAQEFQLREIAAGREMRVISRK